MPFTPISTLLPRKMLKKHCTLLTLQGCTRFSGMEQIVTRHSIKIKRGLTGKSQQAQRINPHIGPPWSIDIPIVILLKFFFLERTGFPADKISSRVAWKFRRGTRKCKRDCQFTTNFAGCHSTIWSCLPIRFKREIVALWLRIRKRTVTFAFNKVSQTHSMTNIYCASLQ